MSTIRAAVIGAGSFGRNHARAIAALDDVELTAIVDVDLGLAQALAQEFKSQAFTRLDEVMGCTEAAIVATPTSTHEEVTTRLLEAGIDVLVEKPIAHSAEAGDRLARLAERQGRVLQVGHLERFNPAVVALERMLSIPLFFEVHRLSVFTPRSLDVDVVLDLMIHDLDIVLTFTGEMPSEIRAAGISVLSQRVDIANVRLAFPSGCIANLTASRVSTEKVRKLRLFQPRQYISLDYQRQDAVSVAVESSGSSSPGIGFEPLAVDRGEPLALELRSFFASVRDRTTPLVTAVQASNALRVAEAILAKIKEHGELVAETIRRHSVTSR
ncbi:MAG TPA: Gfo/Idh/MocA family oxidoreductase [Bryobacteraceae bacterium]|jgi:predicted dehydrogenase|nr:Gfo/Idh/MocA family oxidoreductase [Bryobacteraceae bacterium]